eukprot:6568965-Prymnesium_polylepis.1
MCIRDRAALASVEASLHAQQQQQTALASVEASMHMQQQHVQQQQQATFPAAAPASPLAWPGSSVQMGMRDVGSFVPPGHAPPPPDTAVSSEWHVHLVRHGEVADGAQKWRGPLAGKSEMWVQCPNGRTASSNFAVHLLPHWHPQNQARVGSEPQHLAVAASNIKVGGPPAPPCVVPLPHPPPCQQIGCVPRAGGELAGQPRAAGGAPAAARA